MFRFLIKLPGFFFSLVIFNSDTFSQTTVILDSPAHNIRRVIAGVEYKAGPLKKFLWGENYRKEWTQAITVPVLDLDTTYGGLTPIELGGGRQTKTLHVTDAEGKRYVLRSVNKRYTLALPPIARGTFVETIANDLISTNHPYAAITIPPMAKAAGVYYANPQLYLVHPNHRLGEYKNIFSNMLVWLEERPDKTHAGKENFGFPKDIDGSEKMVEIITDDNDFKLDQHHYVKTRLFDMLVGDWGRHIDNWRWAQFDSGKMDIYRPVPKDRDQTQAKFEGTLFNIIKTVAGLKQLQSFDDQINDITWFNFPAMEIDRRFTNELSRQVWIDSAKALQQSLTDAVIDSAVRKLPPEIFAIRGEETIRHLKKRKDDLVHYANAYYDFLSNVVEVPGTKKHEFFRITRLNNNETQVNIFKISKEGEIKNQPLYSRKFLTKETKEIRLYGIDGNDIFHVEGKVDDGITIRIIGGPDKDSLFENSSVKGGTHKTKFYDNPGTSITASPETKIRMDDSTFVYPFDEEFKYDVKGSRIAPGLNTFYRLFVGVGFKKRIHGWREKPFKYEQEYGVNFSLTEKSFHPYYRAIHPQIFSSWNLKYGLGFDGIRRINFFGIGNETINRSLADEKFNWLRTRNIYSFFGLDQFISKYHNIGFELTYDGVMVVPDDGRFISESNQQIDPSTFKWKHFGGTRITYSFLKINDRILPTKGADFTSSLSYTLNLKDRERSLTRLSSNLKLYIPIWNDISLFTNSGAATLWGQPEFYQYNNIGGGITLRGFVRTRFYGKSVVYQQNELRWLPTVRSYLFNGKAGLVALYDFGRVFIPGESSDKWHSAYGGGFVLSPFNKISATVLYSVSDEDRLFNLRLGMFF